MNNPYPKNQFTMPVAWLQVTGYAHDWLFKTYGSSIRLYDKPVLSLTGLDGARDILRMETAEDMTGELNAVGVSLSAMRMDCLQNGCKVSPEAIGRLCGLTKEQLVTFVPVECPRMALMEFGVLRPWNRQTCFGKRQAAALYKLLMSVFWKAVEEYDLRLREGGNGPDTAIEMIQGFCQATGTNEIWLEDLRREWQRRISRRTEK